MATKELPEVRTVQFSGRSFAEVYQEAAGWLKENPYITVVASNNETELPLEENCYLVLTYEQYK